MFKELGLTPSAVQSIIIIIVYMYWCHPMIVDLEVLQALGSFALKVQELLL